MRPASPFEKPATPDLRLDQPIAIDGESQLLALRVADAEALLALTRSSVDYLRQWMTWVPHRPTLVFMRTILERSEAALPTGQLVWFGIWRGSELAGCVVLNSFNAQHRAAEVSYWLGERFAGAGLATKACRALLDHLFEVAELNRAEIRCAAGNERSRRIPEKLGFTAEGTLRQANFLHDHYVDIMVYGLLRSEWQRLRRNRFARR
jgi:ribosomal-protein-serine acetyltransferase